MPKVALVSCAHLHIGNPVTYKGLLKIENTVYSYADQGGMCCIEAHYQALGFLSQGRTCDLAFLPPPREESWCMNFTAPVSVPLCVYVRTILNVCVCENYP